MNQKFQAVAESITDKKLRRTAISLYTKYKPTAAKELERASRFAFDLYFKNYQKESLEVCEILEEENFTGNYNLWTWIESALFLKCWILWNSDKQNNEEIIKNIIHTINSAVEFGNDQLKKKISLNARDRRLNGGLLYDDRIEIAIKEGDREFELLWRTGQFKELLFIYFLGGSTEFPKERAWKELEENEAIIKHEI
ncbi:hypothetical protein HDF26_004313 [Pedobacter cryoconitis]|uniref:DUF6707 family protein n=1 Tax=Pedobacter cryoconitis TaxID=188932 RepID=UPI001622F5AD|nr:DUF6707 family protein [Pedobacter cryoconitis]MBB6273840.1 hypothetical protein [Pedobacter cryoconitis]